MYWPKYQIHQPLIQQGPKGNEVLIQYKTGVSWAGSVTQTFTPKDWVHSVRLWCNLAASGFSGPSAKPHTQQPTLLIEGSSVLQIPIQKVFLVSNMPFLALFLGPPFPLCFWRAWYPGILIPEHGCVHMPSSPRWPLEVDPILDWLN